MKSFMLPLLRIGYRQRIQTNQKSVTPKSETDAEGCQRPNNLVEFQPTVN
jgi:hypothetical protein